MANSLSICNLKTFCLVEHNIQTEKKIEYKILVKEILNNAQHIQGPPTHPTTPHRMYSEHSAPSVLDSLTSRYHSQTNLSPPNETGMDDMVIVGSIVYYVNDLNSEIWLRSLPSWTEQNVLDVDHPQPESNSEAVKQLCY